MRFVTATDRLNADAGEGAARQVMALDVVDLRDIAQELEMDEVLAGPDREAIGEVHQPEASREDLLDIEAVQQQGKLGAQAEAPAHAERGERVGVLGDARVEERAHLLHPERVGHAQAGPRPLREVVRLLGSCAKP